MLSRIGRARRSANAFRASWRYARRMAQRSAGILLTRERDGMMQVLLVRPGGPFWRGKDRGAWQIPKGLIEPGEDSRAAAIREVEEELGIKLAGEPRPLATIRQAGGKWVEAFTLAQDVDVAAIASNRFELEWPPRSGRLQRFPELEEARWSGLDEAREMILLSQVPLLRALKP